MKDEVVLQGPRTDWTWPDQHTSRLHRYGQDELNKVPQVTINYESIAQAGKKISDHVKSKAFQDAMSKIASSMAAVGASAQEVAGAMRGVGQALSNAKLDRAELTGHLAKADTFTDPETDSVPIEANLIE